MAFTIAIAGRPNVGKSTLFNRLVGKRLALVDDQPGLTRDRREANFTLGGEQVSLIDTAGLEVAGEGSIEARMRRQTEAAIEEADLVLFIIDARAGITPADEEFASLVRTSGKPVVLAANKCEGRQGEEGAYEAYKLGLGDPVPISAEHGLGMGDLYAAFEEAKEAAEGDDALAGVSEDTDEEGEDGERALKVAIVGRPNAGKSTLVNTLIGEERMITGPEAGLTRDSIAVDFEWHGRSMKLFDTAGLRKRARVNEKAEQLSVSDALRAIRFAEVVVLLIDPGRPLEKQDLQIASLVADEGRALLVAINKWDAVQNKGHMKAQLREALDDLLPQVKGVPMVTVSALKGDGIDHLLQGILSVYDVWNKRISTGALNRFLQDAVDRHTPPAVSGRRIRLRYMTQANARPPTFILFCSRPEELPSAYTRYLVNCMREAFDLQGVPIRLHMRKGKNPYAKDD